MLGLNPNYKLEDKSMQKVLKLLKEKDCEVGLHGSYLSHNDPSLLEKEKNKLEKIWEKEIQSIRQHFLNFSGRKTSQIYNHLGFRYESNCGYVMNNGFFCQTSRPFYAIIPGSYKKVISVPMIYMDAVNLYFIPKEKHDIIDELTAYIRYLKQYNGIVAFNFHQRMISSVKLYQEIYEEVIHIIYQEGGEIISFDEMPDILEKSKALCASEDNN